MAVKICAGCGESNKENARICIVCSNSLKNARLEGTLNSEKKYERTWLSEKKTITHCNQCHEKVEANALKCKYCGTTISRTTSPKSIQYSGQSYDSSPDGCAVGLLFVATFLVPLVGLIVGGIFSFNDDPSKQEMGVKLLVFGLAMIGLQIFLYLAVALL